MVFTEIGNFFPAFSATNNGGDRQKKNISQGIAGFPGLTIAAFFKLVVTIDRFTRPVFLPV
jgi:hypothetical protein